MNLRLSALLTLKSDGTQKVAQDTGKIANNLDRAQKSAQKMTATGAGGLARSGGIPRGDGDGLSRRDHAVARGVAGARGASGRDFAGLAQMGGETNGIVAAYATLAANVFALTAAFKALSDAAKFVQLAKGLETVGAQSGRTLSIVAQNMEKMSGYAISTVEAMKAVASATAAGFSGKEIERLTRVAKGASVALGRDMSDSIDRLTRGTIKLEPELLDELGIMTRIDEAVRGYALQHKLAASALTQTQRRQAFLNAVLAEGEMKFGDIADAVDPSAYDKLAASIKKFGTETLSVMNGALKPFIDALIAVPALGLLPLAGMLSTAFGKLIPDMDANIEKHTTNVRIMQEAYAKAHVTMGEFQDRRVDAVDSNLTTRQAAALRTTLLRKNIDADDNSRPNLLKAINALKEKEYEIEQRLRRVQESRRKGLENHLFTLRAGIESLKEELRVDKQATQFAGTLNKADLAESIARGQQGINERLAQNIYESGGGLGGSLKAYGTAFQEQTALVGASFQKAVTDADQMNKTLENGKKPLTGLAKAAVGFGGAMQAIPGFVGLGLQALQQFMGTIFVIIASVQLLIVAWGWVEEKILGNTKRVKELRGELNAVQETASKTAIEIGKLQQVGRFGQSIDAAIGSMTELYEKTKQLREEKEKIEGKAKGPILSIADRVVGERTNEANLRRRGRRGRRGGPLLSEMTEKIRFKDILGPLNEETKKTTIATGDLLGALGTGVQDAFVNKIKSLKGNPDAINNYLEETLSVAAKTEASFKDIGAAAKSAGETLAKIRTPDMFVTNYTPVVASLKDMSKSFDMIKSAVDKLGGDAGQSQSAMGEQIFAGGVSFISELGRLNNNSDQIFEAFNQVSAATYDMNAAINKYTKDSPQAEEATKRLAKAQQNLFATANVSGGAIKSFWEDTQKVIKQTELASLKLKANLADAQASFMKTGASIAKLRRETDLLSVAGTTKYQDAGIEEVLAAQTSYDIARKTAGIKMAVIDAEYKLIEAEIKLQQVTMRQAQQQKNAKLYETAVQMKDMYGTTSQSVGIADVELRAMLGMLEAVDMIGEQLDDNIAIRGALQKVIGGELALEQQVLATAVAKLDAYSKDEQIQLRGLELGKKALDGKKELLSVTKQISDLQVAGFRSNIEQRAFREQRSVTAEEQRSIQELTLTKALENLKLEQSLVMQEHKFKMQILNLEWTLQKLSLQKQLDEAKIARDSARPGSDARKTGENKVDYLTKVLENATATSEVALKSGNALGFALMFKNIAEARAATEALKTLPTVMEQFMNDYWKPRNDATRAFNASGGGGNWLSLFDAGASATSREMGKNAPEGMKPEMIQAMAVSQELFNTQLGFTDQILGTIASSFSTMFEGLIDGTVKAKDAFKQFALSIFKMIAEIATRMLILQTLQMFLPGIGAGGTATSAAAGAASGGGGIAGGLGSAIKSIAIPRANGGYMEGTGLSGVINKPIYAVGEGRLREAAVPLPDGRSIPVQLSGGGNKNNVQVNVNLNADGSSTTTKSGEDMSNLGSIIAQAVQKELQAQKAPGGMLNKYGVA